MPVPYAGCGVERRGFSLQSRRLFVLGQAGVLMGVPDADCGGGEAGDLKAVPNIGCGVEMWVSHGSPRRWLLGGGRLGSHGNPRRWLWEGGDGVSHGSPGRWLLGGEAWFSWQSQTLVVGGGRLGFSWQSRTLVVGERLAFFMAVSDAGCLV